MPRSAVALQVPLNDEPVVATVEDIDACSTVYADDPRDIDSAIECRLSFDGKHFFGIWTACNYCGVKLSATFRTCG